MHAVALAHNSQTSHQAYHFALLAGWCRDSHWLKDKLKGELKGEHAHAIKGDCILIT